MTLGKLPFVPFAILIATSVLGCQPAQPPAPSTVPAAYTTSVNPDGTTKVSGDDFQIQLPKDWKTESTLAGEDILLRATWNATEGKPPDAVGNLTIQRLPNGGKTLRQHIDDRLALNRFLEGMTALEPRIEPFKLADGSDAIYLRLQMDGNATDDIPAGRMINHFIYAQQPAEKDNYYCVFLFFSGEQEHEALQPGGNHDQRAEQAVKSLVLTGVP